MKIEFQVFEIVWLILYHVLCLCDLCTEVTWPSAHAITLM